MSKGAKERIVPIGSTVRGAIVRYIAQRGPGRLTLMVKRYVSMAGADVAAKHQTALPAGRLFGKPGR